MANTQVSLAAKISALRVPRNIRTRGVTNAEHDPVIEKTVRIAVILREICDELNNFKGMHLFFNRICSKVPTNFKFSLICNRCIGAVRHFEIEFAIEEEESSVL